MILVDTPVWSLGLRRKSEDLNASERHLVQILHRIIADGQAELMGSVRQELLSGLRDEAQFRRLRDFLRDFPDAAIRTDDYEEAARAANRCRREGIATSSIDMLICAIAVRHDWEILTTDRDFIHYRKILKIRLFPGVT